MRKPAIMVQATNSDAGKSLLVAGLCRHFARTGLAVRPFKPQNMSNNAAVAEDGRGEIGRAQALQAKAARTPSSVHMNPVLLKPESECGSQVILQGRRAGRLHARDFREARPRLLQAAVESFALLEDDADLLIVEGAGSASEVNLRAGDIANMGFAAAADLPVILTGDVERGGLIASLVGTHALLSGDDGSRVRGFVVNKFRGDPSLFVDALALVEERTGWPGLGIVPWFADARSLPAEDALGLVSARRADAALRVAVPQFARIANFDDLDPLGLEAEVDLVIVPPGEPLPVCDLVVLCGSKSTIADLALLRREGWDVDLLAHRRRGGRILGLCGGMQMLGRRIADPDGIEGPAGAVAGLGLLDIETELRGEKTVRAVAGRHLASGAPVTGYEIHLGVTTGADLDRPWLEFDGRAEGALSADGRVAGTYVHGLFTGDAFRCAWLAELAPGRASGLRYDDTVDRSLDALADHLAAHLDMERIITIARSRVPG